MGWQIDTSRASDDQGDVCCRRIAYPAFFTYNLCFFGGTGMDRVWKICLFGHEKHGWLKSWHSLDGRRWQLLYTLEVPGLHVPNTFSEAAVRCPNLNMYATKLWRYAVHATFELQSFGSFVKAYDETIHFGRLIIFDPRGPGFVWKYGTPNSLILCVISYPFLSHAYSFVEINHSSLNML